MIEGLRHRRELEAVEVLTMERRANRPAALFSAIRWRDRTVFAPSPSFVTKRVSCVGSTLTAADDLQRRHRPVEALGSAFAASLLVHLALLASLVLAGWGAGVGRALWSSVSDGPLEVVLATTRPPADKANAAAAVEVTRAATVPVPNWRESALPPQDQAETGSPGRGRVPRVVVDDRVPRARFGVALEGEALSSFPAEVESPVRLPGKLAVPYPRTALEARREGTVLAWAIVDRQGAVEETTIVSGQGDFNEVVRETLARTRFIPARDGGATLRFYIMLKFDFRLEDRGGPSATSAPAK
jgi:TonB family protein